MAAQLLIYSKRRIVRVAVCLIGVILAAGLAWKSAVVARADFEFRQNNAAAIGRAIHLEPGNAAFHALLAEHIETFGGNPDGELEAATNLSPFESRYWIRRAFRAEVEQKYSDSERYLLAARRVDLGFDPPWALMNYYFRRGRTAEFWGIAPTVFAMSYGSVDEIFRLCLAAGEGPETVEKIKDAVRKASPSDRRLSIGLLSYLTESHIDLAASLAAELVQDARASELPVFLEYCRRQMSHDDASALKVWNALCRRKIIPFRELSPESGVILTDGDLTIQPMQPGFDWLYGNNPSVTILPMESGTGVSLDLGGQQEDDIALLSEAVPLAPGRSYQITFEYRLVGSSRQSGVTWAVRGIGDQALVARSGPLDSLDWQTSSFTFDAGKRSAAQLALEHTRIPTTGKWTGTVQIRWIKSVLAETPNGRSGAKASR